MIVAKVRLRGTCCHDETVVKHLDWLVGGTGRVDDTPFNVKAGHLGQKHLHISIVTVDMAQRRGYLARGEDAGGHLVEKRLEEMVVAPVDKRDVDVARSGQQPARGESSKAATHDYDAVPLPPTSIGVWHQSSDSTAISLVAASINARWVNAWG